MPGPQEEEGKAQAVQGLSGLSTHTHHHTHHRSLDQNSATPNIGPSACAASLPTCCRHFLGNGEKTSFLGSSATVVAALASGSLGHGVGGRAGNCLLSTWALCTGVAHRAAPGHGGKGCGLLNDRAGALLLRVLRTVPLGDPPEAGVYSEPVWEAEGAGPEPTVGEGSVVGGGGRGQSCKRAELKRDRWELPWEPWDRCSAPSHPLSSPGESPLLSLNACRPSPAALYFLGESRLPASDSGPGCLGGFPQSPVPLSLVFNAFPLPIAPTGCLGRSQEGVWPRGSHFTSPSLFPPLQNGRNGAYLLKDSEDETRQFNTN